MNIAADLGQVTVALDRHREVSTAKQRAIAAIPEVLRPREAPGDEPHGIRHLCSRAADEHVIVGAHKAVAVDLQAVPARADYQAVEEQLPILILAEHCEAPGTTVHHVMPRAFVVDTQGARHLKQFTSDMVSDPEG